MAFFTPDFFYQRLLGDINIVVGAFVCFFSSLNVALLPKLMSC